MNSEVGKFQTEATDQTRGTPTERELDLVGGLSLKLVGNIHRSLLGIWLNIRHKFFLIEVTHLRQLTQRTHDIGLRIELTGLGIQLTANDMLVDTRVTRDIDLVDCGGLALVHTHLEINTVVFYIDLDRLNIEEQVATVGIKLRHGIVVALQALV